MFRPALSLAAALLVTLAACATTDETASAEATTAADTQTAATQTTTSTETTTTNTAPSGCNADAARSLVGQMASAEVVDQARLAAGAETARTLKPGQATTMEFNGNRLNLDVDASNTITNVRCG
jgi:type VI protein secretion system component VasK